MGVDPVHNVLVMDGTILGKGDQESVESVFVFDRTASGEAKPLRVISGPKTGIRVIRQMQVQPKGGWIIITQITDGRNPEPLGMER